MANMKVTLDVKVDISDDTMNTIMRILEIWHDNNPDKRIVCEREMCDDGFKHHVHIEAD